MFNIFRYQKMQLKMTLRFHLTLIRMAAIKKTKHKPLGMGAHIYNPSSQEAEIRRLSLKLEWAT
jgi:hypothetical protein